MIPGRTESSAPTHFLQPLRRGRCPHRPDRFFPAPTAGHTGPALQGVVLSGPGGQSCPPLQIRSRRGDVGIAPYAQHESAAGRGVEDAAPYENSIIHRCVGATLAVARRTAQKERTRRSVLFYIAGFQPVSSLRCRQGHLAVDLLPVSQQGQIHGVPHPKLPPVVHQIPVVVNGAVVRRH